MTSAAVFPAKYIGDRLTVEVDFSGDFPGIVITSATVTVAVLTGEDPNPSAMLIAAPVIRGTRIRQKITGGLSGVIYVFTFSVTTSTGDVHEIQANQAVLPYDGNATPIYVLQLFTTPPYPAWAYDSVTGQVVTTAGFIYNVHYKDPVQGTLIALDGLIRNIVVRYTVPPDPIQGLLDPLDGTIVDIIKRYIVPPNEIQGLLVARDGTIRDIVLRYFNYIPEPIRGLLVPTGGTIT